MGLTMSKLGYGQRIKQRISSLERTIAAANAELNELVIAERVLNRLGADEDEQKRPDDGLRGTTSTTQGTVADVAVRALQNAGPMDTPSLVAYLQSNWRADLKQTTLSSTMSRVKSEGRVAHVGGKWTAKKNEPPEGDSNEIDGEAYPSSSIVDVKDLS